MGDTVSDELEFLLFVPDDRLNFRAPSLAIQQRATALTEEQQSSTKESHFHL